MPTTDPRAQLANCAAFLEALATKLDRRNLHLSADETRNQARAARAALANTGARS